MEYREFADATESDVDWVGHPSPRGSNSAKPFVKSRPFSHINIALKKLGHSAIDWRLDETAPKPTIKSAPKQLLATITEEVGGVEGNPAGPA